MSNKIIKIFLLILIFSSKNLLCQFNNINSDTLIFKSNFLKLNSIFWVDSLISVKINSFPLKNNLYYLSKNINIIKLDSSLIPDSSSTVIIDYITLPVKLNQIYYLNKLHILADSSLKDTIKIIEKFNIKKFSNEIFGKNLQKSGTIYRGFSFGTNRDLTLNSGLRLQLAGNISEDIEIVAALTDESTPLQPEGNTKNIQELDKVFIQLKHPNVDITFGDFNFVRNYGTFSNINKKLQGLSLKANYQNNEFSFVYASARGKFNTQTFYGIDGIRGPYRLTGKFGERDIIVLAGTEKVFLNGELLTRGINNDYIIEYGTGEIFFTPKIVITSSSRISIDYEYSDRKYQRNFLAASLYNSFFDQKLNINLLFIREGDNKDNPIDIELSESDKSLIISSGTDRLKSSKTGISFVGKDSLGKPLGSYVKIDTIIAGNNFTYYKYSPNDTNALYNASFSFIGPGQGDYIREGLGIFKFVGINQGNYLPVILLPIPEINNLINLNVTSNIFDNFYSNFELSYSHQDQNTFSKDASTKLDGLAGKLELSYTFPELTFIHQNFGKLELKYLEQITDKKYRSFNRVQEVEFNRNWNIDRVDTYLDERIRTISLLYSKDNSISLNTSYGNLKRGNNFSTDRLNLNLNSELFEKLKINLDLTKLKTNSEVIKSDWFREYFTAGYDFKLFTAQLVLNFEQKNDYFNKFDSLLISSLKFFEYGAKLISQNLNNINISTEFLRRIEYFPFQNSLVKSNSSNIYILNFSNKNLYGFSNNLSINFRTKFYSEKFKTLGNLDNKWFNIRFLNRGEFLDRFLTTDFLYEAGSQYSSKLEKVFLRVNKGTGNYVYIGDKNNNSKVDEFDFVQDNLNGDYILTTYPTEELFPVTDLKTSFRIQLNFEKAKYFKGFFSFINYLSTETYLRVEENSKDENTNNIYFLKLSKFLNEKNTLKGSNLIQQDIFILQNNTDFNIRLRFIEKNNLTQYNLSNEKRYNNEKSIRLRWKLVEEISNQSEYNTSRAMLFINSNNQRNFDYATNLISTSLSYFPYKRVEINFKVDYLTGKDYYPVKKTELSTNSQEISFAFSVSDISRLIINFQRTELKVNNSENYLPFEIIGSNIPGNNYYIRLNFDYRYTNNLQSNIYYEGRASASSKLIHSARAEFRAFF